MKDHRRPILLILLPTALAAFLIGWVYTSNYHGFTRDVTPTTVPWGFLCAGCAAVAAGGTWVIARGGRWLIPLLRFMLGLLAMIQLPPIMLWALFDNQVVADGPSGPIGSWKWALPHLALLALSLLSSHALRKRRGDIFSQMIPPPKSSDRPDPPRP